MLKKTTNFLNKNRITLDYKALIKITEISLREVLLWTLSLLFFVILPYWYISDNLKFSFSEHYSENKQINLLILFSLLLFPLVIRLITFSEFFKKLGKVVRLFILTCLAAITWNLAIPIIRVLHEAQHFKAIVAGKFNDTVIETKAWIIQKQIDRQTAQEAVDYIIHTKIIEFPFKDNITLLQETLNTKRDDLINEFTKSAQLANELLDKMILDTIKLVLEQQKISNTDSNNELKENLIPQEPNKGNFISWLQKGWDLAKTITSNTTDFFCTYPKFTLCILVLAAGTGSLIWLLSCTDNNEDLKIAKDLAISSDKSIQVISAQLNKLSATHNSQANVITNLENNTTILSQQVQTFQNTQVETNQILVESIAKIEGIFAARINEISLAVNVNNGNISTTNENLINLTNCIKELKENLKELEGAFVPLNNLSNEVDVLEEQALLIQEDNKRQDIAIQKTAAWSTGAHQMLQQLLRVNLQLTRIVKVAVNPHKASLTVDLSEFLYKNAEQVLNSLIGGGK